MHWPVVGLSSSAVSSEKSGPSAPLPVRERTDEAELEHRNALMEQALPEHEKAVMVRVPTSAPTFHCKLPIERWVIGATLLPLAYLTYYALFALIALWGAVPPLTVGAMIAAVLAVFAMIVRRLVVRPELHLDGDGLRFMTRVVGRRRTIPIAALRGFVVQVKRRSMDNRESCHLYASLTDGRTVHIGRTRTHEEASAVIRGLEETLATIRVATVGYRAAF